MTAARSKGVIAAATLAACVVPVLGYIYLGPLYSILFATGYLGGFLLWLKISAQPQWITVRLP